MLLSRNAVHTKHAFPGHDDLLGLFFYRKRSHQGSYFFGSLPFCKLTKTLLSSPDTGVNYLQEELAGTRIENEDGAI